MGWARGVRRERELTFYLNLSLSQSVPDSKSKCQELTGVSPLKNHDGFLKSDSASNAEILNTQFKSVFTEDNLSNLLHKGDSPYPSMDNTGVSQKGVFRLLQNL